MQVKNMKENTKISVTIATYNRAHLLSRAINSVINQTYQNFELIIVDDCSTDNTKKIVNSFKDNRIVYYQHDYNKGYLAARNTGFDIAQGKYNCQLGDDDELLPNALETLASKFNTLLKNGVKIMFFDVINAETKKVSGARLEKESYITSEDLLSGKLYGDYWVAVDMESLNQFRYDKEWYGAPVGDGILWLKLLRKYKGYYIPETLYKAYREHGGVRESNVNRTKFIKYFTETYLYEKTFLEENGNDLKRLRPSIYGQRLHQYGLYQILNNEVSAGQKTLCTSFKFHFSLKYFILLLFSFIIKSKQLKIFYIKFFNIG